MRWFRSLTHSSRGRPAGNDGAAYSAIVALAAMNDGRAAMAVSYQRLVAPNASVSLGGAISGGESSVSAGAGFSW